MRKNITKSVALKVGCAVVAAVSTLGVAAFATAGETEPEHGRPNVASLRALSVFDDATASAMSHEDHELLADILPATADSGLLTKSDLGRKVDGRILMSTSLGESYSASRMREGQVCWTYRVSIGAVIAGCAHELNEAGIDPSGAWTADGQTLFGLADDTVTSVQVRTNHGATQTAPMGRNSYHWNSTSPTREVYGVAIVVTHVDDSVDVVNLPDEGLALGGPAS